MGSFYTDVIAKHPKFRSTKPVADLALLEPVTRARVQAIVAAAAARGVRLAVFETYRSRERQQLLFEQGVTKLRAVGVHHYGLAADLVRVVAGAPSWKGDFTIVGELAREHGLVWGGDWGNPGRKPGFPDPYHVQRCTVARQATLFDGSWYPGDAYDPYADGARRPVPRGVALPSAPARPRVPGRP